MIRPPLATTALRALALRVLLLLTSALLMPRAASAQTGACCIGTSCFIRTFSACDADGGDFLDGPCTGNPCAVGRCCLNGTCLINRDSECAGPWTSGGSCTPNPCPPAVGACCASPTCTTTTQAACSGPWTSGASCSANPCGACCDLNAATCQIKFQSTCTGAATFFDGAGSSCSPNPCVGACCNSTTLACTITTSVFCGPIGEFQGRLSLCSPDPCPAFAGACCTFPQNFCARRLPSGCAGGAFFGAGSACSPDPCSSQAAACCTPATGACTIMTIQACNDLPGTMAHFHGSSCSPNPCRGACCNAITFECLIRDSITCVINGVSGPASYFPNQSTCSPNPCPSFAGACCLGSGASCQMTLALGCGIQGGRFLGVGSSCLALGPLGACCRATACTVEPQACCSAPGMFQGPSTQCGPPGNPTTCCPANFNGVGGVSIPDIFAFLTAWFAGNISADFNGVGGVTVADIFAFLHAWFAGCS